MCMGERLSFWVALGTVVVCGIATGVVMHAVGVIFVAGTLVARGQALVSTARPEDATSALAMYAVMAAIVEAILIKLGVGALTRFTISFPRALGAGVLTGVLGLLPVAVVLARPVHSMVAAPGIEPGFWMLALPLSLAVLGLHALLVAGLSEPRGSRTMWNAYARTAGRR
jgi:hypothetical protein